MKIQNKNIVCFIASMRGKKSKEYEILSNLLKKFDVSNRIEVITAEQVSINHCKGCCNCFVQGGCPQDEQDSMKDIKKKLLDADIIIISSPVYLHHISGIMKDFIDRIAYWSHIFQLIGKRVIVCSCTDTSGNEYVISYLKKAFQSFGGYVAGEILMDALTDGYEQRLNDVMSNIVKSYKYPDNCKTTSFQDEIFYTFKKAFQKNQNMQEAKVWKEKGLLNFDSMSELLTYKLKTEM